MAIDGDIIGTKNEEGSTYIVDLTRSCLPHMRGVPALELEFSESSRSAVYNTLVRRVDPGFDKEGKAAAIKYVMDVLDKKHGNAGIFAYEVPLDMVMEGDEDDVEYIREEIRDRTNYTSSPDFEALQVFVLSGMIQKRQRTTTLKSLKEAEKYLKFYKSKIGLNQ